MEINLITALPSERAYPGQKEMHEAAILASKTETHLLFSSADDDNGIGNIDHWPVEDVKYLGYTEDEELQVIVEVEKGKIETFYIYDYLFLSFEIAPRHRPWSFAQILILLIAGLVILGIFSSIIAEITNR